MLLQTQCPRRLNRSLLLFSLRVGTGDKANRCPADLLPGLSPLPWRLLFPRLPHKHLPITLQSAESDARLIRRPRGDGRQVSVRQLHGCLFRVVAFFNSCPSTSFRLSPRVPFLAAAFPLIFVPTRGIALFALFGSQRPATPQKANKARPPVTRARHSRTLSSVIFVSAPRWRVVSDSPSREIPPAVPSPPLGPPSTVDVPRNCR